MQQVPEYDIHNTDSLVVLTESDVISRSDARRFRKELARISDQLRLVWGPTHVDEMSIAGNLKYLDFKHDGKELGERRWFIEIHRDPAFLQRSGRYQLRYDDDGTTLLKSIPSEGCWDYWLRLERANLTYHPPDAEALEVIRALWQWEQMPQSQRDDLERADREQERRQLIEARRRQRNDLWGFDPDLFAPEIASDDSIRFVRRLTEI